jgi:hypothetical protein
MAASLDLARAAYDLLVNKHPEGLSRAALAMALKTKDRIARDAVNGCRVLAATNLKKDGSVYIIGFDPETERYCAAQTPQQARRIIAYQESRVNDMNQALAAQKAAFARTFKQSYQNSEQGSIF